MPNDTDRAFLAFSLGPVQSFIAAARSVGDLVATASTPNPDTTRS